jgi:L-ribulose-5-phosphate 3-epimerase UlaE
MKLNLGIMQGRLVEREIKSRLQSFPKKNWIKEIKLASKLKIKFIEWTLDYKDFYQNPLIKNPTKLKSILSNNNISVKTVTCDFFMQKPPFKDNSFSTEYLIKLISAAKTLGMKCIIIPLVDNSSIKNSINEKKIIKYFKDLKKKVSLGNIKIAFELDLKPIRVFNFIKNFDNSFGVNYDLGNSAFYGYYFNNEKIYFSRVINIHLKDRNQLGYSVPFGKGKAEFDNLFKYIKKIKYKNLFILQSYIPKKIGSKTHTLKNLEFIKQFYDKKK